VSWSRPKRCFLLMFVFLPSYSVLLSRKFTPSPPWIFSLFSLSMKALSDSSFFHDYRHFPSCSPRASFLISVFSYFPSFPLFLQSFQLINHPFRRRHPLLGVDMRPYHFFLFFFVTIYSLSFSFLLFPPVSPTETHFPGFFCNCVPRGLTFSPLDDSLLSRPLFLFLLLLLTRSSL